MDLAEVRAAPASAVGSASNLTLSRKYVVVPATTCQLQSLRAACTHCGDCSPTSACVDQVSPQVRVGTVL